MIVWPLAIVTSSAEVGTTPPQFAQVPAVFQLPVVTFEVHEFPGIGAGGLNVRALLLARILVMFAGQ